MESNRENSWILGKENVMIADTDTINSKIIEDNKTIGLFLNKIFNKNIDTLPTINDYREIVRLDYTRWMEEKFEYDETFFTCDFRSRYTKFIFPILTDELFTSLRKIFSDLKIYYISELCGGTGWFTYWLRKYGIPVKNCVDNYSWKEKHFENNILTDIVEEKDAIEYVKENSDIELFLGSWFYMDDTSLKIWQAMKPGQYFLSIGEDREGCTDSDEFFAAVFDRELEKESNFINHSMISFWGIHDRVKLYRK